MARTELLAPTVPLLEDDPGVPNADTVAASLTPLRWLLERIGEGVTLTQAGRLPKALVLEANDTFGWFDLPGFSVRTETDVHQLHDLHLLARQTRLLTKKGRRLAVSAAGRRALTEPAVMWRTVVVGVFDGHAFEQEGAALAAAALTVDEGSTVPVPALEAKVAAALVGRWRFEGGGEPDRWAGLHATRDYRSLGQLFGWLEPEGDWEHGSLSLTPSGRQASLRGLRVQACAPRTRP